MDSNKILNGGTRPDDPIETATRKVFLIGTPVGILSLLAVWGIGLDQHNLTVANIFILPLLASVFLLMAVLYWRHVIQLRTFELVLYGIVLSYALVEFASIVMTITFLNGSFGPIFTLWLPFVFILGFLVLNTKRALLLSALFFLAMLILGVASCLHFLLYGLAFPDFTLLLQVYIASGFYIAVLYLVSRIKESYISERVIANDLSKLAMTDSLTQVDNRRLLTQLLNEEVTRAERHYLPLSILLFDLDRFKDVNDTFGHNAGDEVLQEVAGQLRLAIRTSDPFGRWGGDEFLVLATNTDGKQAVELAERLRDTLENFHFSTVGKVTASFGVTTYQIGDSPETLIRRADMGLYKAKSCGRNRVEAVIAGVTLPLFEGDKPYPDPAPKE
ncbi:MAG: GGDEF domain-containing protein [Anaerolineales bacterium]|jgi:diguanylate cyclase (GGDEF)-like protein